MSEISRKVEALCSSSVVKQQQRREVLFVFLKTSLLFKKNKRAYSNSIKQLSRVSHWESWFIKLFPAPEHLVVDTYPRSSMGITCWYCISGISEEATSDIDSFLKMLQRNRFPCWRPAYFSHRRLGVFLALWWILVASSRNSSENTTACWLFWMFVPSNLFFRHSPS